MISHSRAANEPRTHGIVEAVPLANPSTAARLPSGTASRRRLQCIESPDRNGESFHLGSTAFGLQGGVDARPSVGDSRFGMNLSNSTSKHHVLSGSFGRKSIPPRGVAASRNSENTTHGSSRKFGLVRIYEPGDFGGTSPVFRANQAVALPYFRNACAASNGSSASRWNCAGAFTKIGLAARHRLGEQTPEINPVLIWWRRTLTRRSRAPSGRSCRSFQKRKDYGSCGYALCMIG